MNFDPMPRQACLQRFENLWSRCCRERAADARANGASGRVANSRPANSSSANGSSTNGVENRARCGTDSSILGAELLERYGEPGRLYHTIDHIDHCLGQFDRVRTQCNQPDAVELAIWFHDAIYNFPAYQNEKLSAAFFMEKSEHILNDQFREDVEALVIATEHNHPPQNPDQRILVDVDLSSFGLAWDKFAADGKNIRQELHYLSDAEFYQGQIAFMESLLSREQIFNTTHFFDSYEARARDNVERYLTSLRERGFTRKGG